MLLRLSKPKMACESVEWVSDCEGSVRVCTGTERHRGLAARPLEKSRNGRSLRSLLSCHNGLIPSGLLSHRIVSRLSPLRLRPSILCCHLCSLIVPTLSKETTWMERLFPSMLFPFSWHGPHWAILNVSCHMQEEPERRRSSWVDLCRNLGSELEHTRLALSLIHVAASPAHACTVCIGSFSPFHAPPRASSLA